MAAWRALVRRYHPCTTTARLFEPLSSINHVNRYSSGISVTDVKSEINLPNLGSRWMLQWMIRSASTATSAREDEEKVVSSKKQLEESQKFSMTQLEDSQKSIVQKTKVILLEIGLALRAVASMSREDRVNKLVHWKDEFEEVGPAFIVIPFMEFLLPDVLKLFPNMLASTFQDKTKEVTLCSPCGILLNGKSLSPLGSNKADFKLKQVGRLAGRSRGFAFATFASNEAALDKSTNGTQRIWFITFKSSGAMGNGSWGHAQFSTTVDSCTKRLRWPRLNLLQKFGLGWWIGTVDAVSFNDEFDCGYYLMCYKKVGRIYMEFLECWSYQATSAGKHDQLHAELNSFLLIIRAAVKKKVTRLILRSDSNEGIFIIMHIWRKRTLEYLSPNKQYQFQDVLSAILVEMPSLSKLACVHLRKRDNILCNIISRLPNQLKFLKLHLIAQKVKMAHPLFEYYSEGILFKELRCAFRDQL